MFDMGVMRPVLAVFKSELLPGGRLKHSVSVKKKELRPKKLFHVPCPACSATARGRCELHSGVPRSEPHLERTLAAIEEEELTRIHMVRDVDDSASQQ
jgi:hypothetical protein